MDELGRTGSTSSENHGSDTKWNRFGVIIPHLVLGILQAAMFRFTVDDTFITLRFARNLAQSGQIVFNIGAAPVEGSSTFLLMLLLVPFFWLGLDVLLVAKVLGVLCAHATLVIVRLAAKRYFPSFRFPFLPALLLSFVPSFAVHSVSGMETSLYMLLIVALVYYCGGNARNGVRGTITKSVLLVLVCWARIEGIVVVGVLLLFEFANALRLRDTKALPSIVMPVMAIGLYNVWRLEYFGTLISPPMAYKGASYGLIALSGLSESLRFLLFFSPLVLAAAVAIAETSRPTVSYLKLLLIFASLFCVTWLFDPVMGYEFRFVFPSLLPLLVMGQPFISRLGSYATAADAWEPARTSLVRLFQKVWHYRRLAPILLLIAFSLGRASVSYSVAMDYANGLESGHIPLAVWVEAHAGPGAKIAVGDVGAIGYYTHLQVIDTLGLLEPQLARGGYNATYVYSLEPDYLVIISSSGTTLTPITRQDGMLVSHPMFSSYNLTHIYKAYENYYLWLYTLE
jgi:hypothetical protein